MRSWVCGADELTRREHNNLSSCTLCALSYSDLIWCLITQPQEWKKREESSKGKRGKLILLLAETDTPALFISTLLYGAGFRTRPAEMPGNEFPPLGFPTLFFSQDLAGRVCPGCVLSLRGRSWISLEKKRFFLSTLLIFLSANNTR